MKKVMVLYNGLLVLIYVNMAWSLNNGLGLTPPMGWLSWERFRCNKDCDNDPENCISENLIKAMTDLMASDGYKDVGYKYVIIDDCWLAETRDKDGRLQPDPKRFPNGIKKLADYVHSKGLLFGIYEDFGIKTCGGYPGSQYHLETDAKTFAEWGVDYLKFDQCNSDPKDQPAGYTKMSAYLNKTGRPIFFSCEWPKGQHERKIEVDYAAVRQACNSWRDYKDVLDNWDRVKRILNHYKKNHKKYFEYSGPGGWNDPDMLDIGNFGLSEDEEKVQMGMWSIMASPLIMSTDLRNMKQHSKSILQNKRLIAINQDPLGKPGRLVQMIGKIELWMKEMTPNGSYAIALSNKDGDGMPWRISFHLKELGLTNIFGYYVTEVFDGNQIGILKPETIIKVSVNPHGIVIYLAVPLHSFSQHLEDTL